MGKRKKRSDDNWPKHTHMPARAHTHIHAGETIAGNDGHGGVILSGSRGIIDFSCEIVFFFH